MIIFLIKVMLAMSLCLGLYHLFLADKKTFVFNRFYLLGSLLLSLGVPFFENPIFAKESIAPFLGLNTTVLPGKIIPEIGMVANNGKVNYGLTLEGVVMSTVIVISSILLIRFCKNLTIQIYKAWTREKGLDHGLRIIVSNTPSPYSFFNTLFVPKDMYQEGIPGSILIHERSHWRHLHSLDLLIVELTIVFHWFNPLIYLYKNALRTNHEYTADKDATIQLGENTTYIESLLKHATSQNVHNQLILSFNHSSIKKRVDMITSNSKSLNPLFFVALLLSSVFILASCSDLGHQEQKVDSISKTISLAEDRIEANLPPPPPPLPVLNIENPTQEHINELLSAGKRVELQVGDEVLKNGEDFEVDTTNGGFKLMIPHLKVREGRSAVVNFVEPDGEK